jgi:hypothetical protein
VTTGVSQLASRYRQLVSSRTMHRWVARLLILVMIVPAFGPLALAHAAQQQAPHCLRQAAKPVMQCHQGMLMAPEPSEPSTETSFQAVDQCCANHDCCRGMAAPRWAQPQSQLLSQEDHPTAEAAHIAVAQFTPSTLTYNDSARAPPRS